MEESVREGPIVCIFLSEFHPVYGPKISYQYPSNGIEKEIFDAMSVYIIPKPQIQKRLITVNALKHKIIGYPNEIQNPKYARNALIFNLCFVCASDARTVHYEPVVKKLSEYLENLELENGFLSDDESKKKLPMIMKQILEDLNSSGKCKVSITLQDRKPSIDSSGSASKLASERRLSMVSEQRRPTMNSQYTHSSLENDQQRTGGGSGDSGGGQITERRKSMFDRKQMEKIAKTFRKAPDTEPKSRRTSDIDSSSLWRSSKKCPNELTDTRIAESRIADTRIAESIIASSDHVDNQPSHPFRSNDNNKDDCYVSELFLKIVRVDGKEVYKVAQEFQVPVLLMERSSTLEGRVGHQCCWDLTTQQVLPHIDGYNHIAKIAAQADVDINLALICIQNLVFYGIVRLLPIFQYSNVYTVTSKIHNLYSQPELQSKCILSVCKNTHNLPCIRDVFKLYCCLDYGVSVRDLCYQLNPQSLHIDEKKVIQFGLMHDLIRSIERYPVFIPSSSYEDHILSLPQHILHNTPGRQVAFIRLCNGAHSADEICCKLNITAKELTDRIEREPSITVIWK